MEPLQRLLHIASEEGLLSPLNCRTTTLRISKYADDVAVFLKPSRDEVQAVLS
jgi:hypothetical protein